MNICIVTPAPARSTKGNRITAVRWSNILKSLGHRVRIIQQFDDKPCDVMIALHAGKSHSSIKRFHEKHSDHPLIVALTGTDLYKSIHTSRLAADSLRWATRLIVLQPLGLNELSKKYQKKTRVIIQSVDPPRGTFLPGKDFFEIAVVGHLRPVKDPFRAAMASRCLPANSRIRIVHIGSALSESMARRAAAESKTNPRYHWVGEWNSLKTRRQIGRSRLLVLTSKMEGGANVICEALAMKVPVISSHIAGSIGLLGRDYPGYFPTGDTKALAKLLYRAETDRTFYSSLKSHGRKISPMMKPAREKKRWADLLREFPSL